MKCLECGTDFEPALGQRLFCIGKCRKRFERGQKYRCFYCGEPGSDSEHILPKSVNRIGSPIWEGRETVYACPECNRALHNSHPFDVLDRIEYLIAWLERRHGLTKRSATCTTEELSELEPDLQNTVIASMRAKEIAFRRVLHARILRTTIIEATEG